MFLETYIKACEFVVHVTEKVGGALTTICDDARALRAVPGLEESVKAIEAFTGETQKIADAYRHSKVSAEESRAFAATMENVLPYLFEFLRHPGMPGHTNQGESLIRRRWVTPRRAQGSSPVGRRIKPARPCRHYTQTPPNGGGLFRRHRIRQPRKLEASAGTANGAALISGIS